MCKALLAFAAGAAVFFGSSVSLSLAAAAPPPAQRAGAPVAGAAADADAALDAVHRAIQQLQAEVAALREENAQLRRQLAEVRRAAQGPAVASTPAAQAEAAPASAAPAASGQPRAEAAAASAQGASDPANKIQRGMTLRQARQILGEPSALSDSGGGTRRATWKGYRQGSVYRVVSADIDANGVIRGFTEAQD